MRKSSILLATALLASSAMPVMAAEGARAEAWSPHLRSGNNKPVKNFAKERARAKTAAKSRRQQRAKR